MRHALPAFGAVVLFSVLPAGDALAAPYASRTLREGTSGKDVRAFQRYLDRAGQDTDADGEFGPATAESLRAVEAEAGWKVDGVATRSDQRLVRKRAAETVDPAESPEPYAAPADDATVGPDGLAGAPGRRSGRGRRDHRGRQQDRAQAVQVRRRPRALARHRLRLLGLDELRAARRRPARLTARLVERSRLGRARPRRLGDGPDQPGHAYMIVAGLRFDTSARKRGATRWSETMRSPRGYVARHPESL